MAGGIKKTEIVEADLNQLSNELRIVGDEIGRIIEMSAKVKPIKGLGDLSKATKETADSAKKIDEVGKQLAASEAKLKQLTDERTQTIIKNRLAIQEATKAQKDKAIADRAEEGSLVRMRQKLRELTSEYDKTGKRTKAAADEIRKLSLSIQDAERSTNRHQRNVGNYTDQLGKLGDKFSAMPGLLGNVGSSISSVSSKLATLGPIGAIIGGSILAIGSPLLAFFTKTELGVEMLERKTAGFKAAFNVLIGDLSKGGEKIADIFGIDNADKISTFWTKAFGGINNALFAGANPALVALGMRMDNASQAAENYVRVQQDLEDSERALIVPRAQANLEIKKAMELYNDDTKAIEVRMNGLKQAIKLEEETAQVEVDHQKQVVENIKIINIEKQKAGQLRDEDDKKLQEAMAKQIDLETESVGRTLRASKRLSTARKEILDGQKKESDERKKQLEERQKLEVELAKTSLEIATDSEKALADSIDKESKDLEAGAKEAIAIVERARKDLTDTIIGQAQEQSDAEKLAFQETAIEQITIAKGNSDKIADIQHQLTLDMIDSEMRAKQAVLDSIGLEPEAYAQANEQLRRLNIQRKEEEIAWAQKTSEKKKAIVSETMTATNALLQQGLSFSQQIYSAQATRAQEAYDTEMAAAGDSLEYQTLAKRKFEAEDKKIKQRQAIAEKLQAILTASLNLALAIGSPNVFAKPILIASAVLGLGMALATPIPQFADGTDFAPSSFIAGEQGSELIRTKSGKVILTPNKATLFSDNSLIGSSIIPHDQTQRMLANMAFNQVREVVDMRDTNKHLSGIEKNTREQKYTDSKGRLVVKRGTVNSVL